MTAHCGHFYFYTPQTLYTVFTGKGRPPTIIHLFAQAYTYAQV